VQKPNAPGLVVVGETDCRVLLVHKICSSGTYTRQGGGYQFRLRFFNATTSLSCGLRYKGLLGAVAHLIALVVLAF
jgi:hypothetical protein